MALSFTNLTADKSTSNPSTTASVNPTSGSLTLLALVQAASGIGAHASGPSGARGTWTQIATITFGRRYMYLWAGTGSVTNEAISITWTASAGFQEGMWSVDEVTGQDTTTPYDTATTNSNTSGDTSLAAPEVGTPGTDDGVYAFGAHEEAAASTIPGGSFTQLALVEGGANVRTLLTEYDLGSPDDTPDFSWNTSATCGIIGVIINADGTPATDDFNRADGGLGSNWTANTYMGGTHVIASNVMGGGTSNQEEISYWNAGTFGDDQYSQVTCTTAGTNGGGPAVRLTSASVREGYIIYADTGSGNIRLIYINDATTTDLDTASHTLTAGEVLKLEAIGTSIKGYVDDVEVLSATHSAYTSGHVGIYTYSTQSKFDDWEGGDVGAGDQSLTPSLYTATNSFYSPTVTTGEVDLTPSLFTNSNTFYGPTVTQPSASVVVSVLSVMGISKAAVTIAADDSQTLTPSFFSDDDTFYTQVVTGVVNLTPSLYTDADAFFTPVVTPGAVGLVQTELFNDGPSTGVVFTDDFSGTGDLDSPWVEETVYASKFIESSGYARGNTNANEAGAVWGSDANDFDTDTRFSECTVQFTTATSGGGGGPALYVPGGGGDGYVIYVNNDNAWHLSRQDNGSATSIATAPVSGGGALVTNDVLKLVAEWTGSTNNITLYRNDVVVLTTTDATYPANTMSPGIYVYWTTVTDFRHLDWSGGDLDGGGAGGDTFYTHVLTISTPLTPSLFTNTSTFFVPVVAAQTTTLTPQPFVNDAGFFTPSVAPGSVTLVPSRFDNATVFFTPTISIESDAQELTPDLFVATSEFFIPTVGRGAVTLVPDFFENDSEFFTGVVNAGNLLIPSRYDNTSTYFAPTVGRGAVVLLPERFDNVSQFFEPLVTDGESAGGGAEDWIVPWRKRRHVTA